MRAREFTKKSEARRLLAVAELNLADAMPLVREIFDSKSAEVLAGKLYRIRYLIKDVQELMKD